MKKNNGNFHFVLTATIFLWLVLQVCTGILYAEESNSSVQRLARLEQAVQTVRQNQEKIEAKNNEIKTELANLRIWIYRR